MLAFTLTFGGLLLTFVLYGEFSLHRQREATLLLRELRSEKKRRTETALREEAKRQADTLRTTN